MTAQSELRAVLYAELRAAGVPPTAREASALAGRLARAVPPVSRKRPRREVETPTFLARAVPAMLRAAGKRVADADPEDLADLLALQGVLDEAIAVAIAGQRERHGRSWADIGRAAGITRQSAHERWGA